MIRASIWAQDIHGVIGDGSAMLWRVPGDFAFFKEQTTGCPVIMGRASFEALGRPLPNRTNIVATRDPGYAHPGIVVVHSLDEAFVAAEDAAEKMGAPAIWVTGGGHVYAETMDTVDRLVVTYLRRLPRFRGHRYLKSCLRSHHRPSRVGGRHEPLRRGLA